MKINIYKGSDLEGVRTAAQASAYVLQRLCEAVTPGMSTLDVDRLAAEFIKETGGKSAFLNYHGYPGQICCSINEVVVHGIGRADKIINPGDIVSLDVGVTVGGFTGDNARSVIAGGPAVSTPLKDRLLDATRRSLEAGIAAARPGNRVCDIGSAVEKVVKEAGFSVVRDMVGHGCGRKMHEDPQVPNYKLPGFSPELKPGMILAIEPMVNVGTWKITIDKEDGWTVRTQDGSLSAHFEHQILITQKDAEVLTWPKNA
ncbi:MAG: type I methionyl aminopeptidase [Lentisphaeria bacterium]|nr:type I methionyl aminopeptidase [Victivallales bacterium]MBR6059666.1 type I methionyl aminopeptidase [Victivallales bacterium]MCR4573405.1 type I methionyl aminopeptidase [Lentisphaeria bacterium]